MNGLPARPRSGFNIYRVNAVFPGASAPPRESMHKGFDGIGRPARDAASGTGNP